MPKPMKLSLRDVRTLKEVCCLERDHYRVGDWSIMTDGRLVWISKQKLGHDQTDHIEIPKRIFDKLFDEYANKKPTGTWRDDKFYPHKKTA